MKNWPFLDPPNTAVFTSQSIVREQEWIYHVTHDEDDGAWQFHPYGGPASEADASVVSLEEILVLDPTIAELADLPLGWCAWRERENSPWMRSRKEPD